MDINVLKLVIMNRIRFEERIIDHNKRDKKSHIYKHCNEKGHRHVWLDNFQIVG